MKTLYISDLDGTLLSGEAKLSEYAKKVINALIAKGGFFTAATSRGAEAVSRILKDVQINVPAVLLNGAILYDLAKRQPVLTRFIPAKQADAMLYTLRKHGQTGLLSVYSGGVAVTYYEDSPKAQYKGYVEHGKRSRPESFAGEAGLPDPVGVDILYLTLWDNEEEIRPVYESLCEIEGLSSVFYRDVYNEGMWFLECAAKEGTKYYAAQYLRDAYGFDRLVGFGDNLNDLPLLAACDESYAVLNAKEEVKEAARAVIGGCADDGVAAYIAEREALAV